MELSILHALRRTKIATIRSVAHWYCLENCCGCKPTVGSNPTLSARTLCTNMHRHSKNPMKQPV
jgi:hypothetical protein